MATPSGRGVEIDAGELGAVPSTWPSSATSSASSSSAGSALRPGRSRNDRGGRGGRRRARGRHSLGRARSGRVGRGPRRAPVTGRSSAGLVDEQPRRGTACAPGHFWGVMPRAHGVTNEFGLAAGLDALLARSAGTTPPTLLTLSGRSLGCLRVVSTTRGGSLETGGQVETSPFVCV